MLLFHRYKDLLKTKCLQVFWHCPISRSFVQKFDIVWVINTEGFDWFIRPFYTKRFWSFISIHIPSVLDELITSPDKFSNTSRRLKRACAESMSDRTAVVSSAYWRSFVSSPPIFIPIISEFWRIANWKQEFQLQPRTNMEKADHRRSDHVEKHDAIIQRARSSKSNGDITSHFAKTKRHEK